MSDYKSSESDTKTDTPVAVALFALLLIPVLTSSATETLLFASLHDPSHASRIAVGMWGACSKLSFGSVIHSLSLLLCVSVCVTDVGRGDGQEYNECTPSKGAYDLTIFLPTISPDGVPQTGIPTPLDLLRGSDTGPLLCLLVSFLLVTVAMVPWFLDVFRHSSKTGRISRIVSPPSCSGHSNRYDADGSS